LGSSEESKLVFGYRPAIWEAAKQADYFLAIAPRSLLFVK